MIPTLSLLLGAGLSAPPAAAPYVIVDDESVAKAAIEEILDDYEAKRRAFSRAYSAAETEEERQRVFEEEYPDAAEYAARLWPILDEHISTDAAADGLIWIVDNDRGGDASTRAVDLLVEHHVDHEDLGGVCANLVYAMPQGGAQIERILEGTPHHEVRGHATYAKANFLRQAASMHRTLSSADEETRGMYAGFLGEEGLAWVMELDMEAAEQEAEQLFELVVENYADVEQFRGNSLADAAAGDLFEIRNLAIGMVAPEIEGADVDGTEFKLSDYRGKVVLLDFWGDW